MSIDKSRTKKITKRFFRNKRIDELNNQKID